MKISPESVKYYASLVNFYSVFQLQQLDEPLVFIYLLCFVYHRYQQLQDNLLNALLYHVRQYIDADLSSELCTMHLYPIDGAVHDVARDATAFSYRDAAFSRVIVGVYPYPENAARVSLWARDYWQALHPYSAGGAYVNFMMEEGQERIRATYRDNYPRLTAVKAKYDSQNLFHVNQNIVPQAS